MNPKIRSLFFACLGLLFGMSVMYIYNNFIADKKTDTAIENKFQTKEASTPENSSEIYSITQEDVVINYVKKIINSPIITSRKMKLKNWLECFSGKSL